MPFSISRFIFILPFLLFTANSHASSLTQVQYAFSQQVKKELKLHNIPGAAYTIVKGNKVLATQTFGYSGQKKKHKINADTIFRLASVSKPFTATIATMLSLENQLNLTDPVTKFVPEFSLATTGAAEKIKLHHILSHSSGLMPNAYDNLLHENWNMDKIIGRFDRVEPICAPAQCYGYQNIAYSFIQPAIEASQSKSFSDLLTHRIFDPLGMDNASVGIDVFKTEKNTAKPHVLVKRVNTGRKNAKGKPIKRNIWRSVNVSPDYYKVEAAAGINASINDMSKWLIANLGYQPQVLSSELLNEVTTPRIKTKKDLNRKYWREYVNNAHYGYGWRLYKFNNIELVYHSGWVQGFRADIAYAPDLDIGFAILINAESNAISKLSTMFWTLVTKEYNDNSVTSELSNSD